MKLNPENLKDGIEKNMFVIIKCLMLQGFEITQEVYDQLEENEKELFDK